MQNTIIVNGKTQQLLLKQGSTIKSFDVYTGLKGFGEQEGSEQTPCGWHQICAKIGENAPLNAVFVGRRQTGEICTPELVAEQATRDWILTRILWLDGLEEGKNRGGSVDTKSRYIYIHGSPAHKPMGVPQSHGCICLENQPLIELFNSVNKGDLVFITEDEVSFDDLPALAQPVNQEKV